MFVPKIDPTCKLQIGFLRSPRPRPLTFSLIARAGGTRWFPWVNRWTPAGFFTRPR